MSIPNWWGDWRQGLTPHTGNLQSTDLIECTMIVAGQPVNTVITGAQILGAVPSGGGLTVGTTAITSGTVGRILFEGTGNVLQESANLVWDNTNGRLGIGTASPSTSLSVIGGAEEIATEQMLAKFSTSTTGKELAIGLVNLSGKYWKIRSLSDGSFDLRNITDSRTTFSSTSTGNISIWGNTFFNNNSNSITNTGGINGLWLQKAGSYTTSNYSICSDSTATFINAVGGGIFFRNSNSTQALLTSGNFLINTTTNAGYRLDVNGTARVQNTLTVTSSSSNGALSLTQNSVGFAAQYIYRPNVTNTIATLMFQDLKSGANFKSFSLGIGRSGDPQWTNSDFIFGFYAGSGGWQQSAKIFNASGNWAIENGTATSDITTAILQVNSTTKGFLPPRMTTTQKNAITTPAAGLVVYDTTLNKLCVRTASAWETITSL